MAPALILFYFGGLRPGTGNGSIFNLIPRGFQHRRNFAATVLAELESWSLERMTATALLQ
eukprot:2224198-Amphidinium_carterae.1